MRILHVVLSLHEGGLERVVVGLVQHATASGHQPHVLCLVHSGQLAEELPPDQYSTLEPQSRFALLAPIELARTLRSLAPDIVHLHSGVWLKGAYACRLAHCRPVLLTDHGRPSHPDPLSHRLLDGCAARIADHVVAVSLPLAEYLHVGLRVPREKLSVIPNGIRLAPPSSAASVSSTRKSLGIPSDTLVVGSVGRLQSIKAYDDLIVSFAELRKVETREDTSPVLLLIGDGPERRRLEELAASLQLGNSVRFLGWRGDVAALLGIMDVFVLPSKSEGTSIALLEAMGAGVAVVATAVGGTPAVLEGVAGGFLVPVGSREALVSAMSHLLRNPRLRSASGRQGRERVEQRYTSEVMAQAYERLYQSLRLTQSGSDF